MTEGGHEANTPFSKLSLANDLASTRAVSVASGGEEVGFQFSSVRLTQAEAPSEASSSSTARLNGTGADFDSAFGSDYSVQLVNALNGVKTLLKVADRPTASGDLLFTLRLDYNRSRLAIYADGDKIDLYASGAKTIELRDPSGHAVFEMPEPLIWDSPDIVYDGSAKGMVANWSTVDYLKSTFLVSLADGVTTVTVAVPESYLGASTTHYPLFVDPSLGPTISTSVQVTDQVVYQESALTIANGGTLKMVNSSLVFNGSYQFQVYAGGKLELINSTVTVNNTATQRVTMTVNGQLYANYSTIEYTQTGVVVASSTLFLNHSKVWQSLGNGISLNSGAGQQVLNSTVCTNSGTGIAAAAGVTGVRLFDSTICSNVGGGASFLTGSGLEVVRTTFQGNGGTALSLSGAASKTIESDRFLSNFVAVTVTASTHYFDNCTVDESTLWDYQLTGGTLWSRASWFSRPKVDVAGSAKLVDQWRLNLTVLDPQGSAVASQAVSVYNRTGTSVASGNTNATGFLSVLISEFNQTTAGREYYSPHAMDYGAGATDKGIPIDVEGNRSLTVRQGGDADADLAPNSNESNAESHWFEAEHWAPKLAWIVNDTAAVGGKAVQPSGISANADFLQTSPWDAYAAGDYLAYFLLRSGAGDANATVTLRVDGAGGQLSSRSLSFNDSTYTWFILGPFATGGSGNVSLKPRVLAGTSAGLVFVDRILLVRTSDGSTALNHSYSFSDWLTPDTDGDGAPDGVELVRADHWKEAETLVSGLVNDARAADRQAASHPDNTALIASWAVNDYFLAGDYQVWIKARSTHEPSDYGITADVDGSAASPGNLDGTATSQYLWFHTENFTVSTNGSHSVVVYVNDSGDPNTSDSDDYLLLDKILVWKAVDYSGTYVPFHVSDVFDRDSDRDNVSDGLEELGYFTADKQEAENYTGENFTAPWRYGLTLNDTADNFTLEWPVWERGYYQLRFPIYQGVKLEQSLFQANCVETDLMWFTNVTVLDSNGQEVPQTSREAQTHMGPPDGSAAAQWVNRTVVTRYRYFFDVGNYSGLFSINGTAVVNLWNKCGFGIPSVNLSYDALFIQKQVLNTMDVDYEDDGLWDGHETLIETFPLNRDSDYDSLTDFEEVYLGADGFVTNPLLNDTDLDGLLDPVELGVAGWDADVLTTTDPTREDTDGDRVPDGWVDGWAYSGYFEYWSRAPFADGLRQFWEGEDLNLDGAMNDLDGSAWSDSFQFDLSTKEALASETDPYSADTDTDGMNDGWEMFIWGYVQANLTQPMVLNPLDISDGATDVDYNLTSWVQEGDALTTAKEYNLNLNPFVKDTDNDFIEDGNETRIGLRTNLADGMRRTETYAAASLADWIFFDPNPFNGSVVGRNYTFSLSVTNASGSSEYNESAHPLRLVYTMWDRSTLYWNSSSDRLYVWKPDADSSDENRDGVLEGTVYRFDRNDTVLGEGSLDPAYGYRWREAPVQVNPLLRDSDWDGVIDGYDGWNATTTASWKADLDGDVLVNAADSDSDGDGLSDAEENGNGNAQFEPAKQELNAYNNDTDSDGVIDSVDRLPLDRDDDDETGWAQFNNSFGSFPSFEGTEKSLGTDPANPDTDNDGVWDGVEDANHNGAIDSRTETYPTDVDSDDDGLWDGFNRTIGNTTYPGEREQGTSPSSRDTDGDLLYDGTELGLTSAGILAGATNGTNASVFTADADPSTRTDPLVRDTDGDTLWDGWQDKWPWNGVYDPGELGEDRNRNGALGWNETDPSKADTDFDRLDDYQEIVVLKSNATNADSDGDGLRDVYEPYPTMDYDGDGKKTIWDNDSDADTTGQYDGNDGAELTNKAVFKTNATNGTFSNDTWVAVLWTDGAVNLSNFTFEQIIGLGDASGLWPINFTADFAAPGGGFLHPQVVTAEGYALWKNVTHVFVQLKFQYVVYRPWHTGDPEVPANGSDLIAYADYASSYRMAYNWSLVLNNDNDHDGLSAGYDPNNTNPDIDRDGLLDGWEYWIYGTNLNVSDTDADGLLDGWEAANWTDPAAADTDNDGLWDGGNVTGHLGEIPFGTNATRADSDWDMIPDGYEAGRGLPPNDRSNAGKDQDNDGLTDWQEYSWRIPEGWDVRPVLRQIGPKWILLHVLATGVWWNGTNASNPDSDSDGISDTWEQRWTEILENRGGTPNAFDPLDNSTGEADADYDGLSNYREYVYRFGGDINGFTWNYAANGTYWGGTNPTRSDTDNDGLTDVSEANVNRTTNATAYDTDGDVLGDLLEVNGWDVNVTYHDGHSRVYRVTSDPALEYTAGNIANSVSDLTKFVRALDPRILDTDKDGISDQTEVANWGADPVQFNPLFAELIPPEIFNVTGELIVDLAGCWVRVSFQYMDAAPVVLYEVVSSGSGAGSTMKLASGSTSGSLQIEVLLNSAQDDPSHYQGVCRGDGGVEGGVLRAVDFSGNQNAVEYGISGSNPLGPVHDEWAAAIVNLLSGLPLTGEQLAILAAWDAESQLVPLWRASVQADAEESAKTAPCGELANIALDYSRALDNPNRTAAAAARASLEARIAAINHLDAVRTSVRELAEFSVEFAHQHPQFEVDHLVRRVGGLALGAVGDALAFRASPCLRGYAAGALSDLFRIDMLSNVSSSSCLQNATKVEVAVLFGRTLDRNRPAGLGTAYYQNLVDRVRSYYCEVSRGSILLNFTLLDNSNQWYLASTARTFERDYANTSGGTSRFRQDLRGAAGADYNASEYNLTVYVYPDWSSGSLVVETPTLPTQATDRSVWLSAYDQAGVLAHELGHVVAAALSDLENVPIKHLNEGYWRNCGSNGSPNECGELGRADTMAWGLYNGLPYARFPDYMSTYTLEDLKRANATTIEQDGLVHSLRVLSDPISGSIPGGYRVWTDGDSPLNDTEPWTYYLIEARSSSPLHSDWDRSVPYSGVYIYRVTNRLYWGETINTSNLSDWWPVVTLMAILTPDAAFPTNYHKPSSPGWGLLIEPGNISGLQYVNTDDSLSIRIDSVGADANGYPVYGIVVGWAYGWNFHDAWEFNYTGFSDAQIADQLASFLFPWDSFIETFLSEIQDRAADVQWLNLRHEFGM